jgi:hypothetical protein
VEKGGGAVKSYTCTSLDQLNAAFRQSKELLNTKGAVNIAFTHKSLQAEEFDVEKPRTKTQNNAIHLYCEQLAQACNDAGYDMRAILREDANIPCTMESIKKLVWAKVQSALYDKQKTRELSTAEVGEIYKVVDRHISETKNIHVEFPSRFNLAER